MKKGCGRAYSAKLALKGAHTCARAAAAAALNCIGHHGQLPVRGCITIGWDNCYAIEGRPLLQTHRGWEGRSEGKGHAHRGRGEGERGPDDAVCSAVPPASLCPVLSVAWVA